MNLKTDSSVLLFLLAVLCLLVVTKLLKAKTRTAVRIVLQTVVGCLFIVVFNQLASGYEILIPLNPLTCFITGVLQLPGVALILGIKYLIY